AVHRNPGAPDFSSQARPKLSAHRYMGRAACSLLGAGTKTLLSWSRAERRAPFPSLGGHPIRGAVRQEDLGDEERALPLGIRWPTPMHYGTDTSGVFLHHD